MTALLLSLLSYSGVFSLRFPVFSLLEHLSINHLLSQHISRIFRALHIFFCLCPGMWPFILHHTHRGASSTSFFTFLLPQAEFWYTYISMHASNFFYFFFWIMFFACNISQTKACCLQRTQHAARNTIQLLFFPPLFCEVQSPAPSKFHQISRWQMLPSIWKHNPSPRSLGCYFS